MLFIFLSLLGCVPVSYEIELKNVKKSFVQLNQGIKPGYGIEKSYLTIHKPKEIHFSKFLSNPNSSQIKSAQFLKGANMTTLIGLKVYEELFVKFSTFISLYNLDKNTNPNSLSYKIARSRLLNFKLKKIVEDYEKYFKNELSYDLRKLYHFTDEKEIFLLLLLLNIEFNPIKEFVESFDFPEMNLFTIFPSEKIFFLNDKSYPMPVNIPHNSIKTLALRLGDFVSANPNKIRTLTLIGSDEKSHNEHPEGQKNARDILKQEMGDSYQSDANTYGLKFQTIDESFIQNFPNLSTLQIISHRISSLLPKVKHLVLINCEVSMTLPRCLKSLTCTNVNGTISFCPLSSIESLEFNDCKFLVKANIWRLQKVKQITIDKTKFSSFENYLMRFNTAFLFVVEQEYQKMKNLPEFGVDIMRDLKEFEKEVEIINLSD